MTNTDIAGFKRKIKTITPLVARRSPAIHKNRKGNFKRNAIAAEVLSWIVAALIIGGIIASLFY